MVVILCFGNLFNNIDINIVKLYSIYCKSWYIVVKCFIYKFVKLVGSDVIFIVIIIILNVFVYICLVRFC